MGNLSRDHTIAYLPFRRVLTEPSAYFRKANTEPSIHFWKANTEPSMHFKMDNTLLLSSKSPLFCQPIFAIHKQVQARTSVMMHLVKAYVMSHHTVTLQICSTNILHRFINLPVTHFESSFIVQDAASSGGGK